MLLEREVWGAKQRGQRETKEKKRKSDMPYNGKQLEKIIARLGGVIDHKSRQCMTGSYMAVPHLHPCDVSCIMCAHW